MDPSAEEPVLNFQNVNLSFGENVALDNVSFQVPAGETRIIFGAAGSGKSVLLKTAIGLLKPQEGEVCLFGQDITKLTEDQLFGARSRVGVLFQEGGLFDSLNIEQNVAYPLLNQRVPPAANGQPASRPAEKKAEETAEAVSSRVVESLRFVELEHTLEKFPSELSGGMRRRVGIARAVVTEAPLVLYDSPTAGLDPITANTIIALIAKARDTRKTTSLLVSHRHQDGYIMANFRFNPETAELERAPLDSEIHKKTRFLVFRQGKLEFEGTQEELQKVQDSYVALFKVTKE